MFNFLYPTQLKLKTAFGTLLCALMSSSPLFFAAFVFQFNFAYALFVDITLLGLGFIVGLSTLEPLLPSETLTQDNHHRSIYQKIEELATKANIAMPQIRVKANGATHCATSWPFENAIYINKGTLNAIPSKSAQALYAHELAHIYNWDSLKTFFLYVFSKKASIYERFSLIGLGLTSAFLSYGIYALFSPALPTINLMFFMKFALVCLYAKANFYLTQIPERYSHRCMEYLADYQSALWVPSKNVAFMLYARNEFLNSHGVVVNNGVMTNFRGTESEPKVNELPALFMKMRNTLAQMGNPVEFEELYACDQEHRETPPVSYLDAFDRFIKSIYATHPSDKSRKNAIKQNFPDAFPERNIEEIYYRIISAT